MIRKITLLFLLCIGMQDVAEAQRSGSLEAQQRVIAQNPNYAQQFQQATNSWASWYTANNNSNALLFDNGVRKVFEIPVVVHVILPGTLATNLPGSIYDPSDATITAMIDYLNQTFRATWSAYPDSNSGGTSIPIQFVLAGRDSVCNATPGIERINGSGVANYAASGVDNGSGTGAVEVTVKNLSRWPTDRYYNIWIVNKIDGKDGTGTGVFTAGYSYNPVAGAPADKDGLVLLATQASAGNTIVPQQMAYALSVLYTFNGGSPTTCPTNTNCLTDGDQICDTEPERNSNYTCPTGTTNPCTGVLYAGVEHNFMDFSTCQNRFTNGQKMRMIWGMYTYRANMIGSLGVVAPGLSPAATSCNPAIPIINNPSNTQDAGVYEVKIEDNFNSVYIGNVPYVYMDYSSGGYNSDGIRDYIDRSCTQEADLVAGNSYKFFLKSGPTSTGENTAIYIDYNNDGNFDPSELAYSHTGTAANELDSVILTMPTSTSLPSLVTCLPIRMRVISDTGAISACGPLNVGQIEDYSLVIRGSGITGSVTAVLPPLMDSSCISDTLNFTAIPSPGAGGPITYQWYVNGNPSGVTTDTFTTNTIADGATVDVKMYYTNQCGTIDSTLSNAIVVRRLDTLLPLCNIALTVGNNPSCPGSPVTFTATPIHAGSSQTFQWQVNGVSVSGATTNTFSSSTLNAGDTVSCIMSTTSPCAVPAVVTSNLIEIFHYVLTSSVTISVNPNTAVACKGKNVIFTATPVNAGSGPSYQWYVKHFGGVYAPVPGATSFVFITSTLQTLDEIQCTMYAPDLCVINHLDTSNQIVMTIDSTYTPYINDSIALGQNPWCLDSTITFGSIDSNFGSVPLLTWLVNGIPVGTGFTYTSDSFHNGDVVILQVNQTDGGCYTSDTLLSNSITLELIKTPDPPLVSLIGTVLTSNVNGTSFQWYYNTQNSYLPTNSPIAGANSQTYHPLILGYYYARVIDTGCESPPSNIIKISLLDVNTYNMDDVKIYPNPSNGQVYLDWGAEKANVKLNVYNSLGQGLMHEEVIGQSQKMLDLGNFANGNYFIEIRDESGNIGTAKITLVK